ncbi:MAG: TonB-dependent receptor, partial [Gammaproteobacteria bacterium]|nr:TonB-dependent receptor [Gammaproteobacteria bacterium]
MRRDNNDRFKDETTYRFTGSHLISTNTRLHSSYGTGVKNPGFVDLFGFFPGSFRGNPALEPEKSEGWDIGVEQHFHEGRGIVDIIYFDSNLEDEIGTDFVFDPSSGNFVSTTVNLTGESERRGIEIFGSYDINDALSVIGSLTFTDSEDPNGDEEIRRPGVTGSIHVNYSFVDNRANLNFGIRHDGSQDDLRFLDNPPFTEVVELDSFTLVKLSGSFQVNDRFRIFGRVENLFDEDYQEIFGFNNLGRAIYFGGEAAF